jgi:peptidoglycan/LPS O-acetylase OafA/YrhL
VSQSAAGHPHIKYRPDIDGLRAVAVLSVVIFHAGVGLFPGGYVGVDVFFVISGFLITTILLRDQSIAQFYLRRARRILPALFAMLVVVLAGALLLFLPSDLKQVGRSTVATLAFVSNMFFWRQSGYFKPDTEIMPLLHTWSLGVEEQYYIFFPLLVILLRRWSIMAKAVVFVLLGLGSLAVAALLIRMGYADTAFYLLPSRAWELLAGAILATGVIPPVRNQQGRAVLGLLGLLLLLWPIIMYSAATPFPGIAAIPPVLGSAMLIAAGNGGPHPVGRLLATKPFVWIGLISYSLYLWHWPVLVFARYRLVRELTVGEAVAAIGVAILLGWASWRFVERPFRHRIPNRAVVRFSIAGAGVLLAGAAALLIARGLPERFPPAVVALNEEAGDTWKCPLTQSVRYGDGRACPLTGGSDPAAEIVLWGDSHAQMYAPALAEAAGGRSALLVNVYGCAPVQQGDDCGRQQERNFATIAASRATTVILAQNWPQYRVEIGHKAGRETLPEEEYRPAIERLERTVAGLRAAGKRVVLVTPIPRPDYELPSVVSREIAFYGRPVHPVEISDAALHRQFANVFAAFDRLGHEPGVTIFDLTPVICPNGRCAYLHGDQAAFADYGHFSTNYARTLGPAFARMLASQTGPAAGR